MFSPPTGRIRSCRPSRSKTPRIFQNFHVPSDRTLRNFDGLRSISFINHWWGRWIQLRRGRALSKQLPVRASKSPSSYRNGIVLLVRGAFLVDPIRFVQQPFRLTIDRARRQSLAVDVAVNNRRWIARVQRLYVGRWGQVICSVRRRLEHIVTGAEILKTESLKFELYLP